MVDKLWLLVIGKRLWSIHGVIVLLILILALFSPTNACFGSGCVYPCHCKSDVNCDGSDGSCDGGCDDGNPNEYLNTGRWYGPGCQIGNIAYQKNAMNHPGTYGDHNGGRAVDGNRNPDLDGGKSCAHPSKGSSSDVTSWTLDLGALYVIYNLTIYNRNSNKWRLENSYVNVYNNNTTRIDESERQQCGYISNEGDRDIVYVTCTTPLIGRHVELKRDFAGYDTGSMNFCEVYVDGFLYKECDASKYGPGCLLDCNCKTGECLSALGYCTGECDPGYTKDIYMACSQECTGGNFGSGCTGVCNCRDSSEVCNFKDGHCDSGCPDRYFGRACDIEKNLLGYTEVPSLVSSNETSISISFPSWSSSKGGGMSLWWLTSCNTQSQTKMIGVMELVLRLFNPWITTTTTYHHTLQRYQGYLWEQDMSSV